jgi:hypothetical protein
MIIMYLGIGMESRRLDGRRHSAYTLCLFMASIHHFDKIIAP